MGLNINVSGTYKQPDSWIKTPAYFEGNGRLDNRAFSNKMPVGCMTNIANWGLNQVSASLEAGNVIKFVTNNVNGGVSLWNGGFSVSPLHTYYCCAFLKSTSPTLHIDVDFAQSGVGWTEGSAVKIDSANQYRLTSVRHKSTVATTNWCNPVLVDWSNAGVNTWYMSNMMFFDLTEIYGAGNEPSKEYMDNLVQNGGSWRLLDKGFINVGGVWKQVYTKEGAAVFIGETAFLNATSTVYDVIPLDDTRVCVLYWDSSMAVAGNNNNGFGAVILKHANGSIVVGTPVQIPLNTASNRSCSLGSGGNGAGMAFERYDSNFIVGSVLRCDYTSGENTWYVKGVALYCVDTVITPLVSGSVYGCYTGYKLDFLNICVLSNKRFFACWKSQESSSRYYHKGVIFNFEPWGVGYGAVGTISDGYNGTPLAFTSSTTAEFTCISINNGNNIFFSFEGYTSSYACYYNVFTTSGNGFTINTWYTPYSGKSSNVEKLDENNILYYFMGNSGGKYSRPIAVKVNIVNGVVTPSANVYFCPSVSSSYNQSFTSVIRLDTWRFLFFVTGGGSSYRAQVLDTSNMSLGTEYNMGIGGAFYPTLTANKVIFYATTPYTKVCDISGGTITFGAQMPNAYYPNSGQNGTVMYYQNPSPYKYFFYNTGLSTQPVQMSPACCQVNFVSNTVQGFKVNGTTLTLASSITLANITVTKVVVLKNFAFVVGMNGTTPKAQLIAI